MMTLEESTQRINGLSGPDAETSLEELQDLLAARGRALAAHPRPAGSPELAAALDAGKRLEQMLRAKRRSLMLEAVRSSHLARYGI